MSSDVPGQIVRPEETLVAHRALVRPDAAVHPRVFLEVAVGFETLRAVGAVERFLVRVKFLVSREVGGRGETFVAD